VNSHISEDFLRGLAALPKTARRQARNAYRLFADDPAHPGLRFKRVHPTRPIYSVRITRDYRALGVRDGEDIVWFWIGSHAEYDKMLRRSDF
jgi:hypothetical protein